MRFLALVVLWAGTTILAQQVSFADRMMAFDKNHDGKLTREEITDERLLPLFDRADANKDGIVTREELDALYAKEGGGRPEGAPGRGPGGGRGGRGGFGPPQQPGQIIPGFLQDRLNLTDEQRQKIQALQMDVDAKLDLILSKEQKQQLRQAGGPPPAREPR